MRCLIESSTIRITSLAALVLLMVSLAPAQYEISFWTIESGHSCSGGSYSMTDASGQCDAHEHSGGSYTLQGGFLPGFLAAATPVPTPSPTPTPTPTPSPTPGITPVSSYDFETGPDGWTFRTPSPGPEHVSHWANCTAVNPPTALGIDSPYDETTNYFALWDSLDATAISYVADSLYQVNWNFSTNRATTNAAPSFRFRIGLNNQRAFALSRAYPGDWVPLAQSPGITVYELFFEPPISAPGLFLAFSIIDFTDDFRLSTPAGQILLEEVNVYAHDLSSFAMWAPESISFDPAAWSQATAPPYDAPTFTQTASALFLQSGINASLTFGSWDSPTTLFSVAPGDLYRLTLTLASDPQLGGPDLRIRVNTDDFRYAWATYYLSSFTAGQSGLPPASGADYHLYLTLPFSSESCRMSFDIIDFEQTQGGTHTLSGAALDSHSY